MRRRAPTNHLAEEAYSELLGKDDVTRVASTSPPKRQLQDVASIEITLSPFSFSVHFFRNRCFRAVGARLNLHNPKQVMTRG